jgi:hypothetical protein
VRRTFVTMSRVAVRRYCISQRRRVLAESHAVHCAPRNPLIPSSKHSKTAGPASSYRGIRKFGGRSERVPQNLCLEVMCAPQAGHAHLAIAEDGSQLTMFAPVPGIGVDRNACCRQAGSLSALIQLAVSRYAGELPGEPILLDSSQLLVECAVFQPPTGFGEPETPSDNERS